MISQIQKCNINWGGNARQYTSNANYAVNYLHSQEYRHNQEKCLKPQGKKRLFKTYFQNLSANKCAQMMQKKNYAYTYSMQEKMAM
jgi:hypothetical protein